MQIKQFDAVELQDGTEVVILDIYDDPPGYEVELRDYSITTDPRYNGALSFAVDPDQVKRVIHTGD